ncbi:amidohydrolase family protein [uncultured Croceicoccus sp.]|uniref:amidohydrolase family protein n=1 Tax=uncultured Croceicoccus sp. TaxID=1295329 RepID=UPI00261C6DA4|nr:amidohydrolase family protein [uncultured Croceicoccus sp.]
MMDAGRLAGAIASVLLLWTATPDADAMGRTQGDGGAGALPPTPSGLPPIPRAEAGATLPLAPEREIAFTVEEGTALQPALSPDGRTIVFAMLGDIYTLPSTGGTARAITRGMAMDTQPVFSPDGRWIAFLSDRSGPENLWIMRTDGSEARQVSFHGGDPVFTSPSWSADGRAIHVSRFWPDRNAYELWGIPLNGDGIGHVVIPTEVDGTTRHALGAVATADGALIYALREGDLDLAAPVEWRIVRRDLANGREELLVKAVGDIRLGKVQSSAFRPALSHDGKTLAYVQRRTGETWLRLHDLTTGRERDLVALDPDALQASFWSDIAPRVAFTPDDAAIIFSKGGKLRRMTLATGSLETIPFRAEVKAGLGPLTREPVRVETGPVHARIIQHPALSPDGSTLAFSALGTLYTMPASGGDAEPVAPGLPPQFHPSWTRDGKGLLFVTWTAADGGHVWRSDLDSRKAERLTQEDAFYTHPVEAPDGSIVTIQSPTADRLARYVEFGQFRQARLVRLGPGGAENEILAEGDMGGTPHFLADGILLLNRPDGVYRVDTGAKIIGVTGPNWYFAQGAAEADDIRVSPDGSLALAQIAQQLHLVEVPSAGDRVVSLSDTGGHRQLSDVGADFFGWGAAGTTAYWSVGSTVFSMSPSSPDIALVKAEVVLPRDVPQGRLLLTGATAITQGPRGTIENADILIENDRIAQIGPSGTIRVPEGTARRDMAGRFVVPGFIDVHDHVADIRRDILDFEPWGPAANLAYGVTTAFDPSTLTVDMLAYQDALDAGLALGSRIFSTGTAIFAFNDFRSRGDVRDILRRYRDHYRLSNIKMYRSGNRMVRQWIAEEAADLGLQPTAEGALAMKLDLTHILDGYSGNEHAIPPPVLYDDVTQLLARSGTSYDLTLQITHGGYPAQDFFIARDAPHGDPKYARLAPPWFRDQKFWQREWTDPAGYAFPRTAASAARVFRAGGLVAIGAHGEVPGLGTHWEMQAHQMGGWTPAEILTAATINGAKAIGRAADLGSIETGKLADLVILSADPRIDIANTLTIEQVMKGGRLYEGGTLAQVWPEKAPAPAFWFTPAGRAAD